MSAGSTPFARNERAVLVERRYREAARHTRWVRFLRRAIPVGAAATVAGILFVGIVQPFRTLPEGVSISNISLNGTKITMELPRLTGFKKDNRPYEVTAQWAAQDVKTPSIIELKELRARIAMQDRTMANVTAVEGVYDSSIEKLDLKTDVRVRTDSGYDVRMNSARIDFKGGNVSSQEPVNVRFSGGTIDSGSLDMTDNGQRIIFRGRVRTVLLPHEDKPASPKDKSQ
jgi:lipopolysaccharide export system protein LptC